MNEALEVGKLLVLVVQRRSNSVIEVIEKFHAKNTINVKEEEKKWHESDDYRYNLQQSGINIDKFLSYLKFETFEEVTMGDQAKQTDDSEYSSHFCNNVDSINWQEEKYYAQEYQYCIYTIPSIKEKVLRSNCDDP